MTEEAGGRGREGTTGDSQEVPESKDGVFPSSVSGGRAKEAGEGVTSSRDDSVTEATACVSVSVSLVSFTVVLLSKLVPSAARAAVASAVFLDPNKPLAIFVAIPLSLSYGPMIRQQTDRGAHFIFLLCNLNLLELLSSDGDVLRHLLHRGAIFIVSLFAFLLGTFCWR
jgi:hypothetical protein